MEGKNGVKQNPSEEKKKEKKNIGRCYNKLLTQFTMKQKPYIKGREKRHETKAVFKGKGKTA